MFNLFKDNSKLIAEIESITNFFYDYVFMYSSYTKNEHMGSLKKAIEEDSDKFIEFRYEIYTFFIISLGSYLQSLSNRSLSNKLRDALYDSAFKLISYKAEKILYVMFMQICKDWQDEISKVETSRGYQMSNLFDILEQRYKQVANHKAKFDIKSLSKDTFYDAMEQATNHCPNLSKEMFGQ